MAGQAAPIPLEWRLQGYDHVGDVDVVDGILYAPFEQPDYTQGRQVTARGRLVRAPPVAPYEQPLVAPQLPHT